VIDDRDESSPPPHSPTIVARLLLREPYFVVASAANARSLRTLRELATQRWISAPEPAACHAALRRLATRGRFEPRIAHVCLELPTVLALVRAGEGIAIVPALAMADAHGAAACPIPRLGMRHLYVVQRTTSRGTEPAVDAVAEAILALRR
jgi:DNA-binding transcriptional LysR family regulator